MRTRTRAAAWLLLLALVAGGCTGTGTPESSISRAQTAPPSAPESPLPVPTGPGSAAAALAKLCVHPSSAPPSTVTPEGPTPPAIAEVERQVEQIRGLEFTEPVAVDPATHAELVQGLRRSFDVSYPAGLYQRRSRAWQTIGVIPAGTSIRAALRRFGSSQVIGYYDTLTHELVFIGSENPSGIERDTLAHELTHAVDDQHFGLGRLDHLADSCQDDRFDAALALAEGDATSVQLSYAQRYLTLQEQIQLGLQGGGSTAGIPPFILNLETWPYTAGLGFVRALTARGGERAVNDAFTHLPVSTEQIIHPERYPNDLPQPVDVPDLAPALGAAWRDLDVMEVGEEWLSILLALRLDGTTAAAAAAGWDGGIYRAWSDGDHVAVVLSTVWDTVTDATQFAAAMGRWIAGGAGQSARVGPVAGSRVEVLFASDPATLGLLRSAAA